jgi:hypothetical protein
MTNLSSIKSSSRLPEIAAILGITVSILFTMELATRETTKGDVQETLFAILAILILTAINIFNDVINKGTFTSRFGDSSVVNVYGDYHSPTNNVDNKTVVHGDVQYKTPENHFDVVRTIEQVPVNDSGGIREVLTRLQSYVETEPALSVSERETALKRLQEIAMVAIANPNQAELSQISSIMPSLDRKSELRSQLIRILSIQGKISAVELFVLFLERAVDPKNSL